MKRMPISERIRICRRGYGILNQYCPGLAGGKAWTAFLTAIQPLLSILFSARIINELSGQKRIGVIVGLITGVITINFALNLIRNVLERTTSEKESQMWQYFEKIFADKGMTMDFADLESHAVQQQKKLAMEDLFSFGNGMAQLVWGISTLVNASTNLLISLCMAFPLFLTKTGNKMIDSPIWLAGILLVSIGVGMITSRTNLKENEVFEAWCEKKVWFYRALSFYSHELPQSLEKAKDARIYEQYNAADRAFKEMREKDRLYDQDTSRMAAYPAIASAAVGISTMICWVYVVIKAALGAFGVGSIVQYVGALSKLGNGISEMMFVFADNEVYCRHLETLFSYLDIPNRKYEGTLPVEKRAFCDEKDMDYQIEFKNVSFRYPGADKDALHNVSFCLDIGKKLAIVGMNGSGKTTFIKLLCRLYDPTEGEIRLNGVDIRKYDYEEYLRIFSVVFQDFKLFSFSLGQNVAVSTDYDREKVSQSLKKAGFEMRLNKMPKGLETCLFKDFESDGVEISGGEAQKIALARALYKDAPFIILDEPTAALDPVAEAEVYTGFDRIAGKKTAIYISHRLASCKFCDEIAVFHEGRIIQRGTHEQLMMESGGKYHEMWNAQAQYYR